MAQRTEKEETEFEVVPETISLCVNNCGVIGNPTTNNMCQNCFNNAATTTTAAAAAGVLKPIRKFRSGGERSPRSRPSRSPDLAETILTEDLTAASPDTAAAKREVNRCSGCRRKVGLTGFRCRCGDLFCSEHRYSDRHDCSYDYRAAGREAIARENPLVRAAKIVRL